jgi:hypothetical protein
MSSYPTYPTVTFKPPGDRPITLWTYDDADNAAAFECPSANKKEECRLLVDRANRTEQDGGKFHDQADAKWIVIRGSLSGHNDTPCGRPTPSRPFGHPG